MHFDFAKKPYRPSRFLFFLAKNILCKPDLKKRKAKINKIGMEEYELTCRMAARKLFRDNAPETLTDGELEMVEYCTNSGTHGSETGFIRNELKRFGADGKKVTLGQKFRYLWKRLFPSARWMRENDRVARRHPWALPFAWIIRLFRGIFKKGGHTAQELRYVMDTEEV
jgi:hypothetical protein